MTCSVPNLQLQTENERGLSNFAEKKKKYFGFLELKFAFKVLLSQNDYI